MKTVIALLGISLLLALGGCTQKASPSDDGSEVLIGHLLRRVSDLTTQVGKQENEILDHDNRCLQEQIAALEGRPIRHARPDPVAIADALSKSTEASLGRISQQDLDYQAFIEFHNKRHPESPWRDLKESLREFCGDCTEERAIRDLQLKEEARQGPPLK